MTEKDMNALNPENKSTELDSLDELEDMFSSDEEILDDILSMPEDLSGFANGFPDWDVHPPKKIHSK